MIIVLVAALIAALSLWVMHWFPWELMLRRELPRLVAYTLGMLAITVPISVVHVVWMMVPEWKPVWPGAEIAALWIVVVAGGLAVLIAYGVDWILKRIAIAPELAELLNLREGRR